MPNYYAHLRFGRLMLAALPPARRGQLYPLRGAFDLGCLGPDPLYFSRHRAVRAEGLALHRCPGHLVLAALRTRLGDDPGQVAYGAGFFCHYALDHACHPYILGQGHHLSLERGLDRALLAADGGGFSWPRLPPAAFRAGQAAYGYTDARAMALGYRAMGHSTRLPGALWSRRDPVLKALFYAAVTPAARRLETYLAGEALGPWCQRDFYGQAPQSSM